MNFDQSLILPAGDQWAVRLNASTLSTFSTKTDAAQATVRAARQPGEDGIAARVVSQSKEGDSVPIWTYGRDGYSTEV